MGALRRISRTAKLRSQREAESNDAVSTVNVGDNASTRGTSPDRVQPRSDRDESETSNSGV